MNQVSTIAQKSKSVKKLPKGRQTYEESWIKFSNLRFKRKNFDEFPTQNNLHIF